MPTPPPTPPRRPQVPTKAAPRPPARRRTVIVQQDSGGPWKSLTIFVFVALLIGAGFYFYLNRPQETPEPVVAKQPPPAPPPVVKLPEIVSNPEKDGERPPPVVVEQPEEPPPVVVPKEPEPIPFVTKLRVVQARKRDTPSQLDLRVWKINPTQKTPLRIPLDDTGRRREIRELVRQYEAIPFDRIVANPLAEDFPGPVPEEAARVIKVANLPRNVVGWHSTGAYAAPGELITIRINSGDRKLGMRAIIGCHRDDILNSKRESWHRFPRITRSVSLTERTTEISNPFGGPIYITMPGGEPKSRKKIRVEIVGGVEAPYYKLGETNLAEWNYIRNAPAPWAELSCRTITLSVPSRLIRKLDNPEKLMQLWEKIIDNQDWLAALPKRVNNPERLVPDAEISAGWMHSGYPVMCYLASAPAMVDYERLTTRGDWGFFHEYGHNRQRGAWTFKGYGEVTNNLFSLYCMETIAGKKLGQGHSDLDKMLARKLADPHGANGPFENLAIYVPVIREFGWESLRNTFAEYHKKRQYRLDTDDRKKETFVRLWSKNCKANLGPYFEKVGFPYTNSMRTSLNQYRSWMPPLPSLKKEEVDSTPTTLFGSKNESEAIRDKAEPNLPDDDTGEPEGE